MPEITGKTYDMPHDRLTGIADEMLDWLQNHPKATGNEMAIVLLTDPSTGTSATSLHLQEEQDESEAVEMIFVHLKALLKTQGKDLAILGNFKTEED